MRRTPSSKCNRTAPDGASLIGPTGVIQRCRPDKAVRSRPMAFRLSGLRALYSDVGRIRRYVAIRRL
ncbi:hypothetical protein DNK65_12420 [Citrobacter koseri]|nr:hypothetical protein DNK65_12420 [Citrobacter koseri]